MRIKVLKEPVTPADEDFQKLSAAQIRWLFAKGAAKDKNGKVVELIVIRRLAEAVASLDIGARFGSFIEPLSENPRAFRHGECQY